MAYLILGYQNTVGSSDLGSDKLVEIGADYIHLFEGHSMLGRNLDCLRILKEGYEFGCIF